MSLIRSLLAVVRDYWWPLLMFWSTIASLIAIAVTDRVTPADAIAGQVVAAGSWLVVIFLLGSVRMWRMLWKRAKDQLLQCEKSRDYWMAAAQANGELAWREEPDP